MLWFDGHPARKRQRGYSFFEVIAALAVVGVVAGIAVKPLNGLAQRIKLQGAANSIKHLLLNARLRAVANPDRQCGVVFRLSSDPTKDDTLFAFLDKNPSDKIYTKGVDSLYLSAYVVKKETGVQVTIPAGYPNVVVFRGDGSASASAKMLLSLKGMMDTVDVLASTGRIRVVAQ